MESKKESSYSREEEHAKQSTGTTGMAGEQQAAAGRGAGVGGSAGRPSEAGGAAATPAPTAERRRVPTAPACPPACCRRHGHWHDRHDWHRHHWAHHHGHHRHWGGHGPEGGPQGRGGEREQSQGADAPSFTHCVEQPCCNLFTCSACPPAPAAALQAWEGVKEATPGTAEHKATHGTTGTGTTGTGTTTGGMTGATTTSTTRTNI